MLLFVSIFLQSILFFNYVISKEDETITVYKSCLSLSDGEYYFQLSENKPIIKAKCSNGYMIIDYNLDNNIVNYFTSWTKYHYAIAGPLNGDQVNWLNWFTPANEKSNFLVSSDCNVCNEENNPIKNEGTNNIGYYMTGNMFGCFWYIRGVPICDFDYDTYECRCCSLDGNNFFIINEEIKDFHDSILFSDDCETSGACPTFIRDINATILPSHDSCAQGSSNSFKPSIGMDGRFCVCYQNNNDDATITTSISKSQLPSTSNNDNSNHDELNSVNDQYELYQKDFLYGTYRITKSGTYTIMEDIIFNFNAPDNFIAGETSPNGIDTYAWWPNPSTQHDIYIGSGEYHGPYFLGFFAGITIECDNVILNLNDHELKMSKEFYTQQRFFSLIELASQPFMPSQGPGMFGTDPKTPSNVIIKNGKLGLTSHHGLHGNRITNINIENLKVYDFETHGIQLNGFNNIKLNNIKLDQ